MNLNDLARAIALAEGGKTSLSIAQVKEVMRLIAVEMHRDPGTVKALLRCGARNCKGR